jgi:hypothetical protein
MIFEFERPTWTNCGVTIAADRGPPNILAAAPTPAGQAALAAAQALAKQATVPATLRAYKADWTDYADWCAVHGFVAVPAAPATVGAYLVSLAGSHAPTTIRRRLSALGKMHRFNDLPWNPAHRDIQGPLQGMLRSHGRPVQKAAAALTLTMLRQILATCDASARGRRDRALLLFGFVGALRRSELVSLHVEDIAIVAGGLRLRIRRGKTDQAGQGAEIGLPRGRHVETCPVRAFEAWQLFRKSAPGMGSATPRCIPMRFEGSWRIASAWPESPWTAATSSAPAWSAKAPPACSICERGTTVSLGWSEGCWILARQFRDRAEARQARAAALVGRSHACPFDLQALLPVPDTILQLGPTHPQALVWLAAHWGVTDRLRQVAVRERATAGRRLPRSESVIGYSFFSYQAAPDAAIAQLGADWPRLHLTLQYRPLD